MSRSVSAAFREAFWGQSTDKAAILLLEISHELSVVPYRFALNTEKVRQNPGGVASTINNSTGYDSGVTALTVDDASGFADADPISISVIDDNDLKNVFDTTVSGAPVGNVITISEGLVGHAPDNASVKKYRDYNPFPFELELPSDSQGSLPTVKLKLDNIDSSVSTTLRGLTTAPLVTLFIVLSDSPDTIEYQTPALKWVMTEVDSMFIQGTISGPQILNTSFPMEDFSVSTYPTLFNF